MWPVGRRRKKKAPSPSYSALEEAMGRTSSLLGNLQFQQKFNIPNCCLPTTIFCSLQEVHSRVDKFLYDSLISGEDEWTAINTYCCLEKYLIMF